MVSCKIFDGKIISKVVDVTHKVGKTCGFESKELQFEIESERIVSLYAMSSQMRQIVCHKLTFLKVTTLLAFMVVSEEIVSRTRSFRAYN